LVHIHGVTNGQGSAEYEYECEASEICAMRLERRMYVGKIGIGIYVVGAADELI